MSGKTTFLSKFIAYKDVLICPNVSRVLYSYKCYQPAFDRMPGVEFVKGENYTLDKNIPTLLIIDDQSEDIPEKRLVELFTVCCHHQNTSLMFITQNLFLQSKAYRTAVLNTQYLFIFKSPRASCQVSHLAKQLCPGKSKSLQEVYDDCTREPYSYMLIDLKPDTPQCLRYRTHVLPDEGYLVHDGEGNEHRLTKCYDF
jgi:hypothetical protein